MKRYGEVSKNTLDKVKENLLLGKEEEALGLGIDKNLLWWVYIFKY